MQPNSTQNIFDQLFPVFPAGNEISEDEWINIFIPIINPRTNSYEFELDVSQDVKFVESVNEHHVWTGRVNDECNEGYEIVPGISRRQELHRMITVVPWIDRQKYMSVIGLDE
ncbi:hypothetical protein ACN2C7_16705 [Caulobacter sp. ErkDOM-E]|uniref:hypothetical protein n=1 Tax=Caulobacter sp. ErkDOM-E TaxID=3402778 RepID=UPI003AF80FBF